MRYLWRADRPLLFPLSAIATYVLPPTLFFCYITLLGFIYSYSVVTLCLILCGLFNVIDLLVTCPDRTDLIYGDYHYHLLLSVAMDGGRVHVTCCVIPTSDKHVDASLVNCLNVLLPATRLNVLVCFPRNWKKSRF